MEYLLLVVCLTAAVTDLLWRRIPNIWLESWFFTGLLLAGAGKLPVSGTAALLPGPDFCCCLSWQAEICYLLRAAAVLAVLRPALRLRIIGAGDVKLGSVMAAFLGFRAFAACVWYSLFFGSIVSFFYLIFTGSLRQRLGIFLAWFRQCISCGKWVPYRKARNMEGTIPFAPVLLAGYLWYLFFVTAGGIGLPA